MADISTWGNGKGVQMVWATQGGNEMPAILVGIKLCANVAGKF